jgi:DNA-directed RNA polymerase specialized sigma24 family protein
MGHHGSVTRLIYNLRSDDSDVRGEAARLIWQRYFHGLLELARSNLDKRVRRRTDEEDVAQSMFKSFCSRQQRGEFELSGRDELWKLLVTITLRKARNAASAHRRKKRDVAREQSAPAGDRSRSGYWIFEEMDAAAPTPQEAMVLNEALERRLQALENPELRQISLWRLEGYTNREISELMKCTERAIERKLGRIRSLWTAFEDDVR